LYAEHAEHCETRSLSAVSLFIKLLNLHNMLTIRHFRITFQATSMQFTDYQSFRFSEHNTMCKPIPELTGSGISKAAFYAPLAACVGAVTIARMFQEHWPSTANEPFPFPM
jgi:hypothetical protein